MIGEPPPLDVLHGRGRCRGAALSADGGADAADAIRTTDTVVEAGDGRQRGGWSVGGMAKGAGMLAPALATMLCVVTTDAVADAADARPRAARRDRADLRPGRLRRLHVDQRHRAAAGERRVRASRRARPSSPRRSLAVCADLARQLIADAEGASKEIAIEVLGAATEDEAVEVARAVSRSNLLKCALHGEDPNWGRVLAAVGTTAAAFDPLTLDVAINGVWVCRDSAPARTGDGRHVRPRDRASPST